MSQQPVNNGYTRCSECSEVYENTMKTCPKCGKANPSYQVNEDNVLIAENFGMVFNIID